jgi:hypothetical protein
MAMDALEAVASSKLAERRSAMLGVASRSVGNACQNVLDPVDPGGRVAMLRLGGRRRRPVAEVWMSQQSLLARMFGLRRRRRAHAARSVSDFVTRSTDVRGVREVAPGALELSALPDVEATQDRRACELEAENQRLRQVAGDLRLQTEILRATIRRRVRDEELAAG